ncbi:hypothetical protein BJX96DRAFT_148185 [Aspergillus floccosus]
MDGNVQFPDLDFFLLDPEFDFPLDPIPYQPTDGSDSFTLDGQVPDVTDLPDLVADGFCSYGVQCTEVGQLHDSLKELSESLGKVQDQLEAERQKVVALEEYVEKLQPFLLQLGESVQTLLSENVCGK